MVWSALFLFNHITMIMFMILQAVVGCFNKFPISISEVSTTIFKIPAKVGQNHMCFQSFIEIKVNFEAEQIEVSIFRCELSPNWNWKLKKFRLVVNYMWKSLCKFSMERSFFIVTNTNIILFYIEINQSIGRCTASRMLF